MQNRQEKHLQFPYKCLPVSIAMQLLTKPFPLDYTVAGFIARQWNWNFSRIGYSVWNLKKGNKKLSYKSVIGVEYDVLLKWNEKNNAMG